jgi:hypothetical protein
VAALVLRRLKAANKALIIITWRQMPNLMSVFGELPMFDYVIAEIGVFMYRPGTREQRVLGSPTGAGVARCVARLGRASALDGMHHRDMDTVRVNRSGENLHCQLIFNKGA